MIDNTLMYSLVNHKVVSIIYMKETEIIQRKIMVLKMDDGMIRALDLDKKSIRSFKIKNILSAIDEKLIPKGTYTNGKDDGKDKEYGTH